MRVKKQQLELDMEHPVFQIGKGVHHGCILSPAYLIYMQVTIYSRDVLLSQFGKLDVPCLVLTVAS